MIGAWNDENYKLYEEVFDRRQEQLTLLQTIEADLMEFGNFSWSDVQKLKVLERRFYVKRINQKLENKKQSQG